MKYEELSQKLSFIYLTVRVGEGFLFENLEQYSLIQYNNKPCYIINYSHICSDIYEVVLIPLNDLIKHTQVLNSMKKYLDRIIKDNKSIHHIILDTLKNFEEYISININIFSFPVRHQLMHYLYGTDNKQDKKYLVKVLQGINMEIDFIKHYLIESLWK